jgi:SAM-dependent methyltransferase
VAVLPAGQYATDANLRARQALWAHGEPPFSLMAWVLDLADLHGHEAVLDVGCGNGAYLTTLVERGHGGPVVGLDLSLGMLRSVDASVPLVTGDAQRLPFRAAAFDVVLAPHMLYHVPDRRQAASELRRVLRPGGRCLAVTNGADNFPELRALVESAAGGSWQWRRPAETLFSLDNGGAQLGTAFDEVTVVETPPRHAVVTDPDAVAAYLESIRDHYEEQLPAGRWDHVVDEVRRRTADVVSTDGALRLTAVAGAFVCR